jgi:hypothetical protein
VRGQPREAFATKLSPDKTDKYHYASCGLPHEATLMRLPHMACHMAPTVGLQVEHMDDVPLS